MLEDLIDEQETYHLVVTEQVLDNLPYRRFYQDRVARGDFVILDSDAFEKAEGSTTEAQVAAMLLLRPTEVVLPDTSSRHGTEPTGDEAFSTAQAAHYAYTAIQAELNWMRTPQFMAVAHGRTWEEYMECAVRLEELQNVVCIGVFEEVPELFGISRAEAVQYLSNVLNAETDIHLLGMSEDMLDLQDPFVQQRCRGVDAGKLVCWGLYGSRVTTKSVPKYPGRPKGYFEIPRHSNSLGEVDLARDNISYWRELTRA